MTPVWIAFAAGCFLGGTGGIITMCLMVMAGKTSREMGE